jgi:hypothetical protein
MQKLKVPKNNVFFSSLPPIFEASVRDDGPAPVRGCLGLLAGMVVPHSMETKHFRFFCFCWIWVF